MRAKADAASIGTITAGHAGTRQQTTASTHTAFVRGASGREATRVTAARYGLAESIVDTWVVGVTHALPSADEWDAWRALSLVRAKSFEAGFYRGRVMSDVREIDAAIAVTGLLDADTERRRPDRSPTVNPALLPLLRNPEHLADPASTPALHQDLQDDPGFGDLDDGNPARGIMFAILFSVPIWAVILYLVL